MKLDEIRSRASSGKSLRDNETEVVTATCLTMTAAPDVVNRTLEEALRRNGWTDPEVTRLPPFWECGRSTWSILHGSSQNGRKEAVFSAVRLANEDVFQFIVTKGV